MIIHTHIHTHTYKKNTQKRPIREPIAAYNILRVGNNDGHYRVE